jgi:hypothetical protein
MTMPAMLAAMMGGGAPSLSIPCARCLAAGARSGALNGMAPENGVTVVAGTLVCASHAAQAVSDQADVTKRLAELAIAVEHLRL